MFSMRRRAHTFDIWPGFVDVLAAVLMVIIFVLMSFVVSQFYLTDALNDRDLTLQNLNKQIETLSLNLKTEQMSKEEAQTTLTHLETQLASLRQELMSQHQELNDEKAAKVQEIEKTTTLSQQISELQEAINQLNSSLKTEETKYKEQEIELSNLHKRLEDTLSKKRENEKGSFGQFRSDFLSKLAKVLGDRQDIRVVGDRFVFQSEVLFDQGSAELGKEGHAQLKKLVVALKEISTQIPSSLQWVLRVDGHTDAVPIRKPLFPSNWELSSARAISVVRYLISQGINPKNLVAAGFGEFQPLDGKILNKEKPETEEIMARNRRIEFRLDQR